MSKDKGYIEISSSTIVIAVVVVIIVIVGIIFLSSGDEEMAQDADENEVQQDIEGLMEEGELEVTEGKFSNPNIVESSVEINTEKLAYIGNLDEADYAIVEFADFLCPFCERHSNDTFPQIQEELLSDEVAYVFSDMPMMDPQASKDLSIAGMCVYHEVGIDELLEYRSMAYEINNPNDENILGAVDELEVDKGAVEDCYTDREYEDVLGENTVAGEDAGVSGVPGFVIGELSEGGEVDGYKLSGALPYSDFEEVVNYLKE